MTENCRRLYTPGTPHGRERILQREKRGLSIVFRRGEAENGLHLFRQITARESVDRGAVSEFRRTFRVPLGRQIASRTVRAPFRRTVILDR